VSVEPISREAPLSEVARAAMAARRRKMLRTIIGRSIILVTLCLGAVIIMAPVLWMISTSLKTLYGTQEFPPRWIPTSFHWENYPNALTILPFATYFKNSAIVTLTIMVGEVLANSFVAYGFARLRGPGRNVLFVLVLSTMLIPYPVIMIPQYILFKNLGWIDTFLPLIVPPCFGSAYLIFLMRQFYLTIPREMDDAAEIDGCSYFGIYRRIMLPLAKPALVTVAIFSFTYNWNDYLAPLIYINSQSNYTLPLGLANFLGRYNPISWHLIMAASLVTVTPCVVLFFFAQRFFIQGVVVSGVKG
jgi:ABC-type glycerol-3-phosphate transport system permease component